MFRTTSSSRATSGQNQNPRLENQRLGVLIGILVGYCATYLVSLPSLGTIRGSPIRFPMVW